MESLYRPAVVKRLLSDYGLRPRKSLGQNFLVDGNIVDKIVEALAAGPADAVIEIGPGLGAVTEALLQAGAEVVAIEKDRGLAGVLRDTFADCDNFTLLEADALAVDFASLFDVGRPVKVAGNLPYYITTPLLMKVLESEFSLARAVVMVQKEVGDRLRAAPGSKSYGALTVGVEYRARVSTVQRVSPTVFYPPPSISSEIICLDPLADRPDVGREDLFFAVVKAAFGKRRKTLKNALKDLDVPIDKVTQALEKSAISSGRRGETLSLAEFADLCRVLSRF